MLLLDIQQLRDGYAFAGYPAIERRRRFCWIYQKNITSPANALPVAIESSGMIQDLIQADCNRELGSWLLLQQKRALDMLLLDIQQLRDGYAFAGYTRKILPVQQMRYR
jgi:hypothetical protein